MLDFAGDIRESFDDLRPYETLWSNVASHMESMKALYEGPLTQQPDPSDVLSEAYRASAAISAAIKDLPPEATAPRAAGSKIIGEIQVR